MYESTVNVTSADGVIPSFYTAPDLNSKWPAIIFYMDAPGIREELHQMARRIAVAGYACIVPDLYHRYGSLRFNVTHRTDAMTKVIHAAYLALTDENINRDTAGVLAWLGGRSEVDSSRIGSVGYCMSGRFITTTAKHFTDRFACAASLYGTRLVTEDDDSPHLHLKGINAELYYAFGGLDSYTPKNYIDTFNTSLTDAGVKFDVDIFDSADHGYCFPERATYDPVAAEASWKKVFDLFSRNLS